MIITNGNKKKICILLLAFLIMCSFNSALSSVPLVRGCSADEPADEASITQQQFLLEIVAEEVKTISKGEAISRSISNGSLKSSLGRLNIVLILIVALFCAAITFDRYDAVFFGNNHFVTVSYILKSDGKK